ncbi:MAG: hypothetical protein CSA60_02515 [Neptuniibacter caesariensis]|uniref:Uncharacterized protein n=1 Tax=Neptuniibacter caesariensis TaxID=207954 RepID=A0A2G6JN61_NEPCE|nr:MAG: hypothetical protein CSA60_02515 [Neptuniibacter caesariensis]
MHISGNLVFSPLWTLFGIRDSFTDTVLYDQLGVFNARTYLYSYYHDFKYLGVVVISFFLGNFLSNVYLNIKKHPYLIPLLGALKKAIYVPFFGDYFFGELVLMFPYILIMLIILFMETKRRI